MANESGCLLVVLAHPDDETYRVGGTLARLSRQDVQVWVLCATRGEAGIPGLASAQAGQVREAEIRCACRTLGIEPPHFLSYRDNTLAQIDQQQAIEHVVNAISELSPQVLLTWPPNGVSGHPDHIAVSQWTREAFEQVADPARHKAARPGPHAAAALYYIVVPDSVARAVGLTHLHTMPDEAVTLAIDVSMVWETKMAAIRCHRSQMESSPILEAPQDKQRLFLGTEHFFRVAARETEDFLLTLGTV